MVTQFKCLGCRRTHLVADRLDGGFCKACFISASLKDQPRLPARIPLEKSTETPQERLKRYVEVSADPIAENEKRLTELTRERDAVVEHLRRLLREMTDDAEDIQKISNAEYAPPELLAFIRD